MEDKKSGITKLHAIKVEKSKDLYKVVDGLNRTLKSRDIMFGLSMDEEDNDKMVVTIYET